MLLDAAKSTSKKAASRSKAKVASRLTSAARSATPLEGMLLDAAKSKSKKAASRAAFKLASAAHNAAPLELSRYHQPVSNSLPQALHAAT